jgi:putative colanic acid biosynthesis acetyltransferase WcaF
MSSPVEPPFLGQHTRTSYTRPEIVLRLLWGCVQATLFRWSPRPFHAFRARLLKLFGADIPVPSEVVIFPTVKITFPWKLSLASRAMLGPEVIVYNLATISLARGANVSQRVHLCAGSHDYSQWSMPLTSAPIHLEANSWIAADVFVGPGVTIGELSVVGARSVVMKSQPPRKICFGNPCRPMRDRTGPIA